MLKVAGTNFEVSHEVTNLDATTFESRLSSLIVRMVHNKAQELGTQLCILIDDGQWLDGASWRLLDAICLPAHQQVLCCVALNGWSYLNPKPQAHPKLVRLHPLRMDETGKIICEIAHSAHADPLAVAAVQSWSMGCPLAIHEFTNAMLERGLLQTNKNWQCGKPPGSMLNLNASVASIDQMPLPARLLNAAKQWWSELDVHELQVLRIASVFGRVVPFDGLIRACPPQLRATVPVALQKMESLQLVSRVKATDRRRVCYGVPMLESRAYEFLSMYVLAAAYQELEEFTKRAVHAQLAELFCREDSLDGWHELAEVRHDTTALWIYHSICCQQEKSWSFLTYQKEGDERLRPNVVHRGLKRFGSVENWCILRRVDGPTTDAAKYGQPGLSSVLHVPWMRGQLCSLMGAEPAAVSVAALDLSVVPMMLDALDASASSASPQMNASDVVRFPLELEVASGFKGDHVLPETESSAIGVAVDYLTYGVQVMGAVVVGALISTTGN